MLGMSASELKAGIYLKYGAWILVFVLTCFERDLRVSAEHRRPFYVVAHMVNSIYELEEYLARGANAVEADLTFNSNGTIRNVYHGYPCDCLRVCDERENFATYLQYLRSMIDPNNANYKQSLTLLFLDLKLSEVSRSKKYRAGEEIAKHLISHLWSDDLGDPRISVLLSIGHTSDSDTIRGVQDTFTKTNRGSALKRLGYDVGLNDDLGSIRKMWTGLGVKANRWQGDGITNCLRLFRDDSRLRSALRIRDSHSPFMEKVYDWTVDITPNIRRSLRLGVDAMLTNFPERVLSILHEPEFKERYRLATKDDNPFSNVKLAPSRNLMPGPSLNTYVSSMREIAIAMMGYAWDFYKLRLQRPGTLFPMFEDFLKKSAARRRSSNVYKERQLIYI